MLMAAQSFQSQFTGLPFVGFENLIKVGQKPASVHRCRIKPKRSIDQAVSFNPKLSGKGKV
jgi:hypothetical protein